MKIKYIFIITLLGAILASCVDLNIPPMSVVPDKDLFSSDGGMSIYLSRMYSQMPLEDFKYSPQRQFFDDWLVTPGTNEGTSIGRDAGAAMTDEGSQRNGPYWVRAFNLLRDANYLLQELPNYKTNFTDTTSYSHYIGEAYYARAMVFYALAKRYGGIPLVTKVLEYPQNPAAELEVPRSSEEDTWNQVLSDFDAAISYLSNGTASWWKQGYATKNVALGFKSEAMLFAACVAKYNPPSNTGFGQKTGVRVIGFDPATANTASQKYFMEAYKAARSLMTSGKYSLYLKSWSATDRDAQYQNMVNMLSDISYNPEIIYMKQYNWPDFAHGYDAYNIPRQLMGGNGYSAGNCPVLDFVELFDGIDKNPDGTIKVFDNNGKYLLFDNPTDIFKNAEPRLRANVIFPMDVFKNTVIEIRRGIFTGDVSNGIDPLMTKNGVTNYGVSGASNYTTMDAYTGSGKFSGTGKVLYLSPSGSDAEIVTLDNGSKMNAGGASGPFTSDNTGAMTGFVVRKWLNPNMPQNLVLEGRSEQPFILMRYGEILLNAAEAALELKAAGVAPPSGDDYQQIAFDAIQALRQRAGATLLNGTSDLSGNNGIQIVRKERRKELGFENKILWDIRRWRTQHSDPLNGSTQGDGAFYRGLYPFYSTKANKYFFDARIEETNKRFYFTVINYYFAIPSDEVSKSPAIDQQPNR
jgi:hypothetical protein